VHQDRKNKYVRLNVESVRTGIQRNKMIRENEITRKPEIIWSLEINEDCKHYQENYMLLFPRYVSAIDEK
jgi:hypothetical protein